MINMKKVESVDFVKVKRGDSLPDVDIDFLTVDRDYVKNYLKQKYGKQHTCSVGTYGRLKLRQCFKDLCKIHNIDFQTSNELTKPIDDQIEYEFIDLFTYALGNGGEKLYEFIQQHPKLINQLKVLLNNPKSVSIHPSAVLVLPKHDDKNRSRELNNWIPNRNIDGMFVCEWEGKYCDSFGLLKNDILGLSQLDKFTYCLEQIKKGLKQDIDLNKIDFEDERVFRLFQNGLNEDVFQFNGNGVKNFCKSLKPDCLEDLNTINAVFRPGPLASHVDKLLTECKHGVREIEYDFGMEKITKSTYGFFVYQEQTMQAFVRAGFSLVESDGVRTQMKKKDFKGMALSSERFITNISNEMKKEGVYCGHEVEEAKKIWDKIYAFSLYGFNRCLCESTNIKTIEGDKTIKTIFDEYQNGIINTLYSLNDKNTIIQQNLKSVIDNGVKGVYEIELENGLKIRATLNHRLLTNNGYKKVSELTKYDEILTVN